MVITYEDANKAVRALYALRDAKHEDKPLLGKFIDVYFLLIDKQFRNQILNIQNYFPYDIIIYRIVSVFTSF